MNNRERFFDRPTKAEEREARRARAQSKKNEEWYEKVKAAREAHRREVEDLVAETDPGPWWQRRD